MTHDVAALGWLAAALTLATFMSTDMARLRGFAVLANLAFIAYGASAALWPVLALHCLLLPINLLRLAKVWGPASRASRAAPGSPPARS